MGIWSKLVTALLLVLALLAGMPAGARADAKEQAETLAPAAAGVGVGLGVMTQVFGLGLTEAIPPATMLAAMTTGVIIEVQTACEKRGMVRATSYAPGGENKKWEHDPERPGRMRLRCE